MKKTIPLILAASSVLTLTAVTAAGQLRTNRLEFDPAITKYVRFLEQQRQSPLEYILGLFETNDLVVICERAHAEVTQYDLIYSLVSDPRFRRQVGNVFIEVGTSALRPAVEALLTDNTLSDAQVDEKLRYIAQNFDFGPVWEKTNIFDFLRKLHYLNRSLTRDRQVHVYPSGIEFRWESMSRQKWTEFGKQLGRRDQIMADNVVSKFKELRQTRDQTKALVIMNYRHAFPHLPIKSGRQVENTTGFLMEAFPGKVANVMINSVGFLPGTTDQRVLMTALQQGKWDAAFAVVANPGIAFDFSGSPFGEDDFDYFPFIPHRRRYQDVFTGFVFFKPLEAHRQSFGLPGLIDASFGEEYARRASIAGHPIQAGINEEIQSLATARVSNGYDEPAIAEKIHQWLKTKP
ncbi:MAG TPA: hypothetical protein VJA21_26650 [Verrucomicrobiae bacterium]